MNCSGVHPLPGPAVHQHHCHQLQRGQRREVREAVRHPARAAVRRQDRQVEYLN